METNETANLLHDIFRDEADDVSEVQPAAQESYAPAEIEDGLNVSQRRFLREIITRAQWSKADFDGLAKREGLMPSAATEAINNWSNDRFDDNLISGDDPVYVEVDLIPENEFGEAA
jgi:hypothetical protein